MGILKLKQNKIGDTIYLIHENLIFKGIIVSISEKENEWDEIYYDVDITESNNNLTELDNTIYNVLHEELFIDINDLLESLKTDLQKRLIKN